ncbi:unnamed protein product [Schistosoma mattheei]|uniref:Uncharacterized protein n=1 Tax=Schistosoma mattheei TaxID=31246 RepID=A0A183P8T3_9TREM|nr:unnamed protein product [Schistosoma mattheei]
MINSLLVSFHLLNFDLNVSYLVQHTVSLYDLVSDYITSPISLIQHVIYAQVKFPLHYKLMDNHTLSQ